MWLAVDNVRMSFGNDKTKANCVDFGPASVYIGNNSIRMRDESAGCIDYKDNRLFGYEQCLAHC